jgi:hypothetical protein
MSKDIYFEPCLLLTDQKPQGPIIVAQALLINSFNKQ